MTRNLGFYMRLPYTVEVVPISEDEGGGYTAWLPLFGRYAIVGDGDTPDEAIANLEETKRERFADYLETGIEIPEPTRSIP